MCAHTLDAVSSLGVSLTMNYPLYSWEIFLNLKPEKLKTSRDRNVSQQEED